MITFVDSFFCNTIDNFCFSAACTCSNNNDGKVGNNTNESQLHDTDSLDEKKRQSSPCKSKFV